MSSTNNNPEWGKVRVQGYNDPTTTPSKYPHGGFSATVSGRDRWALECLKAADVKGCTPIDTPGPRWSAYVKKLRDAGFHIETNNEPHGEPFPGTHARYTLETAIKAITPMARGSK